MNNMQLERKLCEKFALTPLTLSILSSKAPKKYRVYYIPKRTSGLRAIAQPTKELKQIQRFLVSELKSILPIHSSAMAYRWGVSIKDNAECHKNNSYMLKMDFQNFFNKIKPEFFLRNLMSSIFNMIIEIECICIIFCFGSQGKKEVLHIY